METKGITIGDWLFNKNGIPKQVEEVYDDSVSLGGELNHFSTINPIPLTREILESNVFEKERNDFNIFDFGVSDDFFHLNVHEYNDGMWLATYYNCEFSDIPDEKILICHVHELQHFLTHCQINKNIIL